MMMKANNTKTKQKNPKTNENNKTYPNPNSVVTMYLDHTSHVMCESRKQCIISSKSI